ncbi:MAG: S8 family serine peptidase [Chitinivibrionales bacterium]|nr:S8 family serine peptidase [Chitinivibrionales bacterium]
MRSPVLFITWLFITVIPVHAALNAKLLSFTEMDTTLSVWVVFEGKPQSLHKSRITTRAAKRRAKANFPRHHYSDIPVSTENIRQVTKLGARLVHTFKWANAASFDCHASLLDRVSVLSCVKTVLPVRTFIRKPPTPVQPGLRKSRSLKNERYGFSEDQLNLVSIPAAHVFIDSRYGAPPGEGVVIGFLDSGFDLDHDVFSYVHEHHSVVADSDFVDHDGDVSQSDDHGTKTLSLVAGYAPGTFMGAAWGARFVLARTEEAAYERHIEEDNWAAAIVWAESLGVDIVNSSLGYRYTFDPPDEDYTFEDMDGRSTIVSLAARAAVERGMLIVNSAGNDGMLTATGDSTLNAPADVEGVVAVGAVGKDSAVALWSSHGPTADGRIKPDCVAYGSIVNVPHGIDGFRLESGTSYSSPITAGVCALIQQSHPGHAAEMIRSYLYASCMLTPWQDTIDNTYGRGIPDAALACRLTPHSVVIHVRDTSRNSVSNVSIYDNNQNVLGITDSIGLSILEAGEAMHPKTLYIGAQSGDIRQQVQVDTTPLRKNIDLPLGYVKVSLLDTAGEVPRTIEQGTLYWRAPDDTKYYSYPITGGFTIIHFTRFGAAHLYASAKGYFSSDTLTLDLLQPEMIATLYLKRRPVEQLIVYPNVVRLSHPVPHVNYDFIAAELQENERMEASIRSIDGDLVWSHSEYLIEGTSPRVTRWDCRNQKGRRIAPGMYIFLLRYNGKSYKREILIVG